MHYGRPLANTVGCAYADGTPIVDAEAARAEAWADAQPFAGYARRRGSSSSPGADRAQEQPSSAGMDRLVSAGSAVVPVNGRHVSEAASGLWRFVI